MDSMKAHLTDDIKKLCKNNKCFRAIIPGGMTKLLQPLDITVNRSFKCKIRGKWEKWMTEELKEYTKNGRMKRASYTTVCEWIADSWKNISAKTVIKGFRKAGLPHKKIAEPQPHSSEVSDVSDSDDEADDSSINSEIIRLFMTDSETSDFEGFSDSSN